MKPDRRPQLVAIGVLLLVAVACFFTAHLLPEGGVLGFFGTGFELVGILVGINLITRILRAVSPDAAKRWDAVRDGSHTTVFAPIFFWLSIIVGGGILLTVEPPQTNFDYVAMVAMWCIMAGGAVMAGFVTRKYLRERRQTAD